MASKKLEVVKCGYCKKEHKFIVDHPEKEEPIVYSVSFFIICDCYAQLEIEIPFWQ